MRYSKQWIAVGLMLWVLWAIGGKFGLMVLAGESTPRQEVRMNDEEGEESSIDVTGWSTVGLAVQEICVECTGSAGRERWDGGDKELRTKDKGLRTCVWWMRELRCGVIGRIVSEKRFIRYYVFGLCKMLD